MGISTVSYTNTPQAKDDLYNYTEEQLRPSAATTRRATF